MTTLWINSQLVAYDDQNIASQPKKEEPKKEQPKNSYPTSSHLEQLEQIKINKAVGGMDDFKRL
ncbi:MAG: hypothetical protein H0U71_03635 [Gammaproteobacteria bacterium]|nr:hypothetical protein [Gammaproteobacteria bacterium]